MCNEDSDFCCVVCILAEVVLYLFVQKKSLAVTDVIFCVDFCIQIHTHTINVMWKLCNFVLNESCSCENNYIIEVTMGLFMVM